MSSGRDDGGTAGEHPSDMFARVSSRDRPCADPLGRVRRGRRGGGGAAYGLLLGLLVVFAVGHFSDVRHESQQEASSLVALHDTVSVYPPETRDPVQHDVICYMRSIVDDEWPSMERGRDLETPRTLALGDRVRAGVRNLPSGDPMQGSAYGHAGSLIIDAGQSHQRLLFFTQPEILRRWGSSSTSARFS